MSHFQEDRPQVSSTGTNMGRIEQDSFTHHIREQVDDYLHEISERLRRASDRSLHYYQQAAHTARADGAMLTGVVVAGAIGFATAWLIFGRHAVSGDYVARRMSQSSERFF